MQLDNSSSLVSNYYTLVNNSAIDDSSSPNYLHHLDSPSLVLVSQHLTSDNYASWSRAMVIAMSVKKKLGFNNESIPKLKGNDALLNPWTRNNNIVISWILSSVSKEISTSLIYATSTQEIREDLKERFQHRNGPCIFS